MVEGKTFNAEDVLVADGEQKQGASIYLMPYGIMKGAAGRQFSNGALERDFPHAQVTENQFRL